MSSFLQEIAGLAAARVAAAKREKPASALEAAPLFARKPHDIRTAFKNDGFNIIAEVKFASPSEGDIRLKHDPVDVAAGYLEAGAAMLSVLTEPQYFKGSLDYLAAIRAANPVARLLRKDFMVDPYQMLEAKAAGADAILLIAAMTPEALTKDLYQAATALGLTSLVEVHDGAELDAAIRLGADVIGVNNRNLKTLKIDLDIGRGLAARKPPGAVFICESGLSTAPDVRGMRHLGYDGFLMGSHFMRQPDPGAALAALRKELSCA